MEVDNIEKKRKTLRGRKERNEERMFEERRREDDTRRKDAERLNQFVRETENR